MKPNTLSDTYPSNFTNYIRLIGVFSAATYLSLAAAAWAQPSPKPAERSPSLLWEAWYTITIEKKGEKPFKYAYYQDKIEKKDGRYIFFNKLWKKEDQYINEESLGTFSKDDNELTPLFFDFYSKYRQTETKLHGEIDEKRHLSVKGTRGNQPIPEVKNKPLAKGVILSADFPIWIRTHLKDLRPLRSVTFLTIFEDNLELGYSPVAGHVTLARIDDYARTNQLKKLEVEYDSRKSTWYVDEEGVAVRIEMHSLNAVVEKTPEATAKLFLQ